MAAIGADGYRQQTVNVNGPITSAGEGVFVANGGRVIIGPGGSIDSTKGIAILATGTVPEDDTDPMDVIAAIPPKLRVDLNLDGRRVAEVIGDGWIINDGGETTLAVNDTILHDGATGVTGNTAHNGVWDVTMLAGGVNVSNYSVTGPGDADPEPALGKPGLPSRDFALADFTEDEVRCPTGQVGTPPNCRVPSPPPLHAETREYRVDSMLLAGMQEMAGVHLEGDCRVSTTPQGSIGADSGIAILADGDASGPPR